jgi:hypothetical protein
MAIEPETQRRGVSHPSRPVHPKQRDRGMGELVDEERTGGRRE